MGNHSLGEQEDAWLGPPAMGARHVAVRGTHLDFGAERSAGERGDHHVGDLETQRAGRGEHVVSRRTIREQPRPDVDRHREQREPAGHP